jgi:hypothetical protein
MLPYAAAIFLGAFLLFQIQPILGKFILPWFGGGPGVWTTCMLFFQVLLLGGYAYAHGTTQRLRPKTQVWVHLALLAAALACLPVIPGERWKPSGDTNPTFQILILLGATIGLPYLVLAATGPLIQHWFFAAHPSRSPYRLYALSNAGSLLALVSFPCLVEPQLSRRSQAAVWGAGLVLYAGVCAVCAWRHRAAPETRARAETASAQPTRFQQALWILLPATASVLLLAVTNKLCQDVAVIPFLWVVPLSVYLLSFIVCFDSERWYRPLPFTGALVAGLTALCWALYQGAGWPLWKQLTVYSSALAVCCFVCHGEVYRLRPAANRLTGYYLGIAAGGALGGVFVALGAPRWFSNYYELHWGLFACALLVLLLRIFEGSRFLAVAPSRGWGWLTGALACAAFGGIDFMLGSLAEAHKFPARSQLLGLRAVLWGFLVILLASWVWRQRKRTFAYWRVLACLWLALGTALLGGTLWTQARRPDADKVLATRNFYGVLTLYDHRRAEPKSRHLLLQHGRITHGLQFVDPLQARWPATYYGSDSGVGLALDSFPAVSRRIGLVGLGTGTLASYAVAGDYLRIYEINPEVTRLATTRFSYLSNCPARLEIIPGDARLSMEREPPQAFDVLALDAFSGDAIPAHLLTREAFELYNRHLKPGGLIAVHISNHFLDLAQVVWQIAREFGYYSAVVDYDETPEEWWLYSSTWVLLTADRTLLEMPGLSTASTPLKNQKPHLPLWTDDFTSLFQILK